MGWKKPTVLPGVLRAREAPLGGAARLGKWNFGRLGRILNPVLQADQLDLELIADTTKPFIEFMSEGLHALSSASADVLDALVLGAAGVAEEVAAFLNDAEAVERFGG